MFTYDLTDEDYELPYNAPGRSRGYFELDDEFRSGVPKRRSDAIKLETILGNSGDMDLDYVGGPTGLSSGTLDRGIRAFQKRNGLKVDGWVRPSGPTITKMKEQFGGLLGDYEAPSPRQTDTHHRMRDAGYAGFLKPKRQDLLPPPIPGLPKPDDTILGANHSLVRTVRDTGMRDTPGWMASLVRRQGRNGVVEARDFVDQLEQLIPGEGTKAIRGILHALADEPEHQRAFFGGPVIETAPVGVFEQDGPARYENAIKTRPWEKTDRVHRPGESPEIRDMAWRPERDGPNQDRTLPTTASDAENAPIQRYDAEGAAPAYNDGLLDPNIWPTHLRGQNEEPPAQTQERHDEALEAEATATDAEDQDAHAIEIAQAQGRPNQTPPQRPGTGRDPRPAPAPIQPQEPFRSLLAERETRNRQDLTNTTDGTDKRPQEVLGLYQLSRDILVDAGLKNRDGSWREGNAAGVSSDDEFLKNRDAQDKALAQVLGEYGRQIKTAGADRVVGREIAGLRAQITVTESGLIAAAHRAGIGNLQTYLKRMEANDWDSRRAVASIERETENPEERRKFEDWHRRIETRLREFGPLNLR